MVSAVRLPPTRDWATMLCAVGSGALIVVRNSSPAATVLPLALLANRGLRIAERPAGEATPHQRPDIGAVSAPCERGLAAVGDRDRDGVGRAGGIGDVATVCPVGRHGPVLQLPAQWLRRPVRSA